MITSPNNQNKIAVVILAAGEGKRMKSPLPKVMHLLRGQPLIEYVVRAVEESGLGKPVVVVGVKNTLVADYLGERAEYTIQQDQLGTGHAVAAAEDWLKNRTDHIVVLYGDSPFVSAESIKKLAAEHIDKRNVLTLLTATLPPGGPRNDSGRIVRGATGALVKIVEVKDASVVEKKITEINAGFYCFAAPWLWSHLKMIRNSNAQGEYYLTDLVGLAIRGGYPVSSVLIDHREALGVNTKEHLKQAEKF